MDENIPSQGFGSSYSSWVPSAFGAADTSVAAADPTAPPPTGPPVIPGPLPASGASWTGIPQSSVPQPPAQGPVTPGAPRNEGRGSTGKAVVAGALSGAVMAVLVLLIASAIGVFGSGSGTSELATETSATVAPIVINPVSEDASVAEAVAAKVLPSVVNVTNMQYGVDTMTGQTELLEAGLGSGVILRSDGYILTNYHVISGADEILVKAGVETLTATVVGADESSDLAVLKIEGTNFTPIEVGSSSDVVIGQWVMAVGSPFGLDQTVTTGIVSALQRSDIVQDTTAGIVSYYTNLIQTDAAINPGNSGGALVDDQGKLIGITSLIEAPTAATGSAQSAGIGFAIPSDYAVMVAEEIIETGKATHPFLGVTVETVDPVAAVQGGLTVQSGAIVTSVLDGSPAHEAGIKEGDIITEMDGTRITAMEDVFAVVRSHKVGDTIEIIVVRGAETLTLKAQLALNEQQ